MADPRALEDVADLFVGPGTVAVIGAHHEGFRPASYVPEDLHGAGWRVLPVNPRLVGRVLWGEPVRATLAELRVPVDVVDVFRRSEDLVAHEADLLAMDPPPRVVWFQQGIQDDALAARLRAAGLRVVQDRCMLADRRALLRRGPAA